MLGGGLSSTPRGVGRRNLVTLSFPSVPCYSETTDGCHEYPDPAFRGPDLSCVLFIFLRQFGATMRDKRARVTLGRVSGVKRYIRRRSMGLL